MKSKVVGHLQSVMFLFKVLTKKFVKDDASQLQKLCEFPDYMHCSLGIITVRVRYHKFCARWVPNMLTDAHKMQRMASALTFRDIPQRW
jgi:hypothetical protein